VDQRSAILWRRLDLPGHEVAELTPVPTGWQLSGVALVAHDGRPCRLEYHIDCDAAWRTQRVTIRGHLHDAPVELDLTRDSQSVWQANGTPVPALEGCPDVDLGFSPSTNLLPIRRLGLAVGDTAFVRAAWVRFPELSLEVLEQTYTRSGDTSYRYESAGGAFRRELVVSAEGLVLEYPDFWRAEAVTSRLASPPARPFAANDELALHVPDPELAERFYVETLGCKVVSRTRDCVALTSGARRLYLLRDPIRSHDAVVPSFDVPDRAVALLALLQAGCKLVPIGPHAPGESYVQDPFGVVFDVIER
jgi:catechol 2,3-dioxygenase-like lactoylglutathione lyase family enzyme